jgi:ABC-type nickel/cobalt efflux system permease component RcnA
VLAGERGAVVLAPAQLSIAVPDEYAGDVDAHQHDHHAHDDVSHAHGWTSHTHIPEDGEAITWRRLIGLGVFGGMIPCPSAIIVMLSAIALHRVGFGLVLIVAFSFGLAAVLTGIGFLVVWAQRVPLLRRAMDRAESSNGALATIVMRGVPIAAAALVFVVGLVMIARASTGP